MWPEDLVTEEKPKRSRKVEGEREEMVGRNWKLLEMGFGKSS